MTPRDTRFDDPATLALLESHRDRLTAAIASLPTQDFAVENARQWLASVHRRLSNPLPFTKGYTGSDFGTWGVNGHAAAIDSAVRQIEVMRDLDAVAKPVRVMA